MGLRVWFFPELLLFPLSAGDLDIRTALENSKIYLLISIPLSFSEQDHPRRGAAGQVRRHCHLVRDGAQMSDDAAQVRLEVRHHRRGAPNQE